MLSLTTGQTQSILDVMIRPVLCDAGPMLGKIPWGRFRANAAAVLWPSASDSEFEKLTGWQDSARSLSPGTRVKSVGFFPGGQGVYSSKDYGALVGAGGDWEGEKTGLPPPLSTSLVSKVAPFFGTKSFDRSSPFSGSDFVGPLPQKFELLKGKKTSDDSVVQFLVESGEKSESV